jgi:flagellar FliJ protein
MKRFNFSLQSLYKLKKTVEKQKKKEMKMIESELLALNNGLYELEKVFNRTKLSYSKEVSKSISINVANQYNNYFASLAYEIKKQKEKIKVQLIKKEECIKAQIETRKEIKSLDNLREKQYQKYLMEVRKEEEKSMDDIVSFKITAT